MIGDRPCPHCQVGFPHHNTGRNTSPEGYAIGGEEILDLHQLPCHGGITLVECWNADALHAKARLDALIRIYREQTTGTAR